MNLIFTNHTNKIINRSAKAVENKQETITDSLILSRIDLVNSDNYSVIMIPMYNVNHYDDVFKISQACLYLVSKYPKTKIIIITQQDGFNFSLMSRLSHFSAVFKISRLVHAIQLIYAFDVTKIICPNDLLDIYYKNKNINKTKPQIKLMDQDILKSHNNFINRNLTILLSCSYKNAKNKKLIKDKINYSITMPRIVLSDVFIPNITCSQITYNGYLVYPSNYINNDIDSSIGISMNLISTYPMYSITSDNNNLFDGIEKHLFAKMD